MTIEYNELVKIVDDLWQEKQDKVDEIINSDLIFTDSEASLLISKQNALYELKGKVIDFLKQKKG